MKPNLENLNEYTSKASLTTGEKLNMFENIRAYSNANPVKSKYTLLFKHSFAYASMFALFIGTSATSIAAEDSLPGEILYPIKVNFNENIIKSLSVTKAQKAKVNVSLVDKRMEELTEMIVKEKDSPEKIDIIAAKLEDHKEELKEYIDNIESSDSEENAQAAEIYAELESVVDIHLDILEEIAENEDDVNVDTVDQEDEIVPQDTPITELPIISTSSENTISDEDIATSSMKFEVQATMTLSDTQEPELKAEITQKVPVKIQNIEAEEEVNAMLSGEEDAVFEISNFSEKLKPIITSAKMKSAEKYQATSTIKRPDIRKRVIETAEKELDITIEKTESFEIKDLFR